MRRYSLVIIAVLLGYLGFGQNPEIKSDVPNMIPPSPTVAALMKFQEVPVSNYTGVPNVSIPLYSSPTRSKDIKFDVSLSYHSGGAAVDEKASDVGLGWSLIAGGTISRTVRGIPDEHYDPHGTFNTSGKIGIYNEDTPFKNRYQEVLDLYNSNVAATDDPVMSEYYWNTTERNVYDTEFDLWQYNFMGHSGQFTIKKNRTTNVLEVSNLDKSSNLKIVNLYNSSSFVPTSFIVYDDLGYKYIFDIKEVTKTNTTTFTEHYLALGYDANTTKNLIFVSAFHLSAIYDNNDNLLASLEYTNESETNIESILEKSNTYNEITPGSFLALKNYQINGTPISQIKNVDPKSSESLTQKRVTTKKIKNILIEGICKLNFKYDHGRDDTNMVHQDSSYVFKQLTIKDWDDNNIKEVVLKHDYSYLIDKRLILTEVSTNNFLDNKKETYGLEYRENYNPGVTEFSKDLWGYFKAPNFYGSTDRETNPDYSTLDLLQKMTLPSGGCIIFDFESNTYSYKGAQALTDFNENPKNYDGIQSSAIFSLSSDINSTVSKSFFTINFTQDVLIKGVVNTTGGMYYNDYIFKIYKVNPVTLAETPITQIGLMCYECEGHQDSIIKNLPAGTYRVRLTTTDLDLHTIFNNAEVTAYYKTLNSNNYQFLYGGGNRIKKIGYFANDVPKDFYQNALSGTPDKEKRYNYDFIDTPGKSSGSLVVDKPIYEYPFYSSYYFYLLITDQSYCPDAAEIGEFAFTKKTDYNNIKAIKTGGADIGYQNVTVSEINNGETQYVYTSPIDYPESLALVNTFPFLPCYNLDYMRGLVKSESVFDKNGKKLSETLYDYEYDEEAFEDNIYGLQTYFMNTNDPFSSLYPYYEFYKEIYDFLYYTNNTGCSDATDPYCMNYISCPFRDSVLLPRQFIDMQPLHAANGWSKLSSKITKNYFYEAGNTTPNIVQTDETYVYNPVNKKIAESTITNSKGEVLKTDYFYHTGDAPGHQNRISEIERIEQYNGTDLLSKSQIVYDNTYSGNAAYLPKSIQTLKGSNEPESRVHYSAYDSYGHPTELQQANGTTISYIWGYNKSQPIAKVENATNAQISAATGINFNDLKESNLTAIDNLRTTLPNAMVTTYTYIPLVGIETITDSRGYTTTYEYDNFGRLARIRDAAGNILSENEYNYKTQN